MMPPTVLIKYYWWYSQFRQIFAKEDAVAALLGLKPAASEVVV